MAFGKPGAMGLGFGTLGALGRAGIPNFSLIWSPTNLAWGGAFITWV